MTSFVLPADCGVPHRYAQGKRELNRGMMGADSGGAAEGLWCKHCGPEYPLRIEWREEIEAKKVGEFSLAGVQMKFSGVRRQWPYAVCDNCGRSSRGRLE